MSPGATYQPRPPGPRPTPLGPSNRDYRVDAVTRLGLAGWGPRPPGAPRLRPSGTPEHDVGAVGGRDSSGRDRPSRVPTAYGATPGDDARRTGWKSPVPSWPEQVADALSCGATPLPDVQRSFFEARFQEDFRSVCLHAGPSAVRAATSLDAAAFTVGDHIVLGERADDEPGLIAHELAHVVQQRGSPPDVDSGLSVDDGGESAADTAAAAVFWRVPGSPRALAGTRGSGLRVRRQRLRPDERAGAADKFAAQTFRVVGDPILVTKPGAKGGPAITGPVRKTFTIFVPSSASPDRNKVHVFFTPFDNEAEFVAEQGLRAQHEQSGWILIAVRGLLEGMSPNWVTVSTTEIMKCLRSADRPVLTINALRLSAHSRGHRGLERTMGFKGKPTVDPGLVERVTVFDASYRDLGSVLGGRASQLTKMRAGGKGGWAPGAVNLYDVTVQNISGFKGRRLDVSGIRALSYVRFVQEGLLLGKVDRTDFPRFVPPVVQDATDRLLAAIPARGAFSTRSPTPAGKVDLVTFMSANKADLRLVDDAKKGLTRLVTAKRLDLGYAMDLRPTDPYRELTAHHWLAAELGQEAID
jgi:hypothetical protein